MDAIVSPRTEGPAQRRPIPLALRLLPVAGLVGWLAGAAYAVAYLLSR